MDYIERQLQRAEREALFWRGEFEKASAKAAQIEATLRLYELRDRTDVAWLQAKIVAQRRELKRLADERAMQTFVLGVHVPQSTEDTQ